MLKIYTTSWCGDCKRSKAWLNAHEIIFEEIDVEKDKKAMEYIQKINAGLKSVPVLIFEDGTILIEPTSQQLSEKLKIK